MISFGVPINQKGVETLANHLIKGVGLTLSPAVENPLPGMTLSASELGIFRIHAGHIKQIME